MKALNGYPVLLVVAAAALAVLAVVPGARLDGLRREVVVAAEAAVDGGDGDWNTVGTPAGAAKNTTRSQSKTQVTVSKNPFDMGSESEDENDFTPAKNTAPFSPKGAWTSPPKLVRTTAVYEETKADCQCGEWSCDTCGSV